MSTNSFLPLRPVLRTQRRLVRYTLSLAASLWILPGGLIASEATKNETTTKWKPCGWGGGGYFWSCAYHPTNPDVIYLGGNVSGLYKTTDRGLHWKFINDGLWSYIAYTMAISQSDPETLFVGTPGGIFKTRNGGEKWEFLERTGKGDLAILMSRPNSVRPIAIDPRNPETVYAGGSNGRVVKSVDGGRNWDIVLDTSAATDTKDSNVISTIAISASDPKLIFASGSTLGIARSDDSGVTWKKLDTPLSAMSVAADWKDANTVYAAFNGKGILKSIDRGETWTSLPITDLGPRSIREIVLHPTNPKIIRCIAVGGSGGFGGGYLATEDGGVTWQGVSSMEIDSESGNPTRHAMSASGQGFLSRVTNLAQCISHPDCLFISADWRNSSSSDGGKTWKNRDNGADITVFTDIQFYGDKVYATAMDEGLLVSSDNGDHWHQLYPLKYAADASGHQWRVRLLERSDGNPKIVSTLETWNEKTPAARVLISEDAGRTFTSTAKGLPEKKSSTDCMWGHSIPRALAVDPKDPQTLYLGIDGEPETEHGVEGGGIFRSQDGGYTWQRLPGQPESRRMFYGLAVCPIDSRRIYWGTCGKAGGVYRSEDGGESWKQVFRNEQWIFNLHVASSGTVYAGRHNLWKSDDHGTTWKQISQFPGTLDIVGIEIDPGNERRMWLSRVNWSGKSEGQVWSTADGGITWRDITGDLPVRGRLVLRYNPATQDLWAAGGAVFKTPQPVKSPELSQAASPSMSVIK